MATYYCSTIGDDSTGDGTINNPWYTWNRPASVLQAGDTIYIRGGTYTFYSPTWYNGIQTICRFQNISGTAENPINIFAYPEETPIWDLTGLTSSRTTTQILLHLDNCDYFHLKGLQITNAIQPVSGVPIVGLYMWQSSHNIIENIDLGYIGGFGYQLHGLYWVDTEDINTTDSDGNLFLNCDAHHLIDPYSGYDASNGFNVNWGNHAPNTTFRGCRVWESCDDGWDFYRCYSPNIIIDNCWSFLNGYQIVEGNIQLQANGFKLGPIWPTTNNDNFLGFTVTNTISAGNGMSGFAVYGLSAEMIYYNNLSYDNAAFGFYCGTGSEQAPDGDASWTIKNNISYNPIVSTQNQAVDNWGDLRLWTQDQNAWHGQTGFIPPNFGPKTLSSADFISLDITQLYNARKADGSLPDVTFGRLVGNSDMIEQGVNVGMSTVPDIGIDWGYLDSLNSSSPIQITNARIHNWSTT